MLLAIVFFNTQLVSFSHLATSVAGIPQSVQSQVDCLDDRGIGVWCLTGATTFIILHSAQDGSGAHPVSLGTRGCVPAYKGPSTLVTVWTGSVAA